MEMNPYLAGKENVNPHSSLVDALKGQEGI